MKKKHNYLKNNKNKKKKKINNRKSYIKVKVNSLIVKKIWKIKKAKLIKNLKNYKIKVRDKRN
jgi:hypothetical protein